MSGTGYEVDLDYLRDTITKLRVVLSGMDGACTKVNYNTNLTRKQFGSDAFVESGNLFNAHESMKDQINQMIQTLTDMVGNFTDKTVAVHTAYTQQENTTSAQFGTTS
ncbi:hypothetical protein [Streptacidiphilus sp. PAMC 29251]